MKTAALFMTACLCLVGCGSNDETASAGSTSGGGSGSASETLEVVTESDTHLLSLYASTPDDVFLFGGAFGVAGSGRALHYDGSLWNELDAGDDPGLLIWSYGFGPDNVWAVGQKGTILHWDGTSMKREDPGIDVDLWGIWGSAPDDIWAVGGVFTVGQATMLHYDGSTWTPYDLSSFNLGKEIPIKVWGTDAHTAWVTASGGIILKYDGTTWTKDTSPVEGEAMYLVGLAGTSASDVYAVGGPLSPPGIILHNDGTGWSKLESELPQTLINIQRIPGTDELVTVGLGGYVARVGASGVTEELAPVTDILLHGIAAFDRDHILISGGNILDMAAPKGVLLSLGDNPPRWDLGQ